MLAFKKDNHPEFVKTTIGDIETFLQTCLEEDPQLENIFVAVFKPEMNFYEWEGRSTRETLQYIRDVLARDVV